MNSGVLVINQMSVSRRIVYLDILRSIAIISVVLMHASSMIQQSYSGNYSDFSYQFTNVFNSITRFAVPLFIMISGSLMLAKKTEYRDICSKVIHFMSVFVFWSLIYTIILIDLDAFRGYTFKGLVVNTIIDSVIGHFHFWYLFLISGIYLLIPILKVIADTNDIKKVFIIFVFVIGFLLPTLCLNTTIQSIIGTHVNDMSIGVLGGHLLYFLLGYWLKDCEFKSCKWIYIATIIAGIYTILISNIVPIVLGYEIPGLRGTCTPNVLVLTVGIFLLVRQKYKDTDNEVAAGISMILSKYSFGVYLIHMLVMNLIKPFCIIGNPVISLVALFLITLLISYLVVRVMYKNKWLKRVVS